MELKTTKIDERLYEGTYKGKSITFTRIGNVRPQWEVKVGDIITDGYKTLPDAKRVAIELIDAFYPTKQSMVKAKLTLPKMQTKRVWAGLYGGHYDQIVFFKRKPVPASEPHRFIEGQWYDCMENKDLIVGDMGLSDFRLLFPKADLSAYTRENNRPKGIDIPEVFEMELTAVWNERGKLASFSFSQDW